MVDGPFTDAELAYLGAQRLGRLATQRADGTLQVSPVGFAVNQAEGTVDVSGHNLATSQKFRNVGANGRAAFVVDDLASTDPWTPRCVEIRGWAEALTEPGGSPAPVPGPVIRLHPTRVISFGVDTERSARDVG